VRTRACLVRCLFFFLAVFLLCFYLPLALFLWPLSAPCSWRSFLSEQGSVSSESLHSVDAVHST
jgi:hypothetical protein